MIKLMVRALCISAMFIIAGCGGGVDRSSPQSVAEHAWKALLKGDHEKVSALVGIEFSYDQQLQVEAFSKGYDSMYLDYKVLNVEELAGNKSRVTLECKTKYQSNDTVVFILVKTDDFRWSLAGAASVRLKNFKFVYRE